MTAKIKTIIIDDEVLARKLIISYLQNHPEIEIVAECADGFSGLKVIKEQNPDLVFLDIQMPKLTGFEMLEVLDHQPVIIFSTAYDEFALKAFEANATDYLLKPYNQDRFDQALLKAISFVQNGISVATETKGLMQQLDISQKTLHRLVLKTTQGIDIISAENIDYMASADDYTEIFAGKKKYLKQKPLKYYDEHLDSERFVRIHRTTLLNISRIARLEPYGKESWVAVLKDGNKLLVSKSGYQRLKELLKV